MTKRILVTGGAGFIGSAVVRHLMQATDCRVMVCDKLTYAGNLGSIGPAVDDPRFSFVQADIVDMPKMRELFESFRPNLVFHLAAESHVDRSIEGPAEFVQTNVVGTYVLLQCGLDYWKQLRGAEAQSFRFHHISTDEVFGSLGTEGVFSEETAYAPNSPYAASKAGADHLVRAWHRTYGFPAVMSNCSNNYGPYHFPEKLIPLVILNALEGKPIPVYGNGGNIRDWLYVEDHVRALSLIAEKGEAGTSYMVGGGNELTNIAVVFQICALMDELAPSRTIGRHESLVTFVEDRPGHDLRYAADATKIHEELGWVPQETFETGLRKTVVWYLANRAWWEPIRTGVYRGQRLGKIKNSA